MLCDINNPDRYKNFALLGFYEVCSSITYHEASG
jgi:hypothetical protein